jgi:hypothetical protein
MNESLVPIGFYVRPSAKRIYGSMPPADAPDWEIWRQVIQPSDLDGIKLVDEILATGMTLRKAWASMVALANPRKEKPARMEKPE